MPRGRQGAVMKAGSERQAKAQAQAITAWHQTQSGTTRCDRTPTLRADEPADHSTERRTGWNGDPIGAAYVIVEDPAAAARSTGQNHPGAESDCGSNAEPE
jgi:hypothetical protein